MKKLTPILFVESIEESLPFWVDRLGFQKTMEVPEDDRLAFVGLSHGPAEVMLQTYRGIENDMPQLAPEARKGPTFLYIEVEDIDAVEKALAGVELVVPRRKTFYGATEIGVREPGGHLVTLAQMSPDASSSAD